MRQTRKETDQKRDRPEKRILETDKKTERGQIEEMDRGSGSKDGPQETDHNRK